MNLAPMYACMRHREFVALLRYQRSTGPPPTHLCVVAFPASSSASRQSSQVVERGSVRDGGLAPAPRVCTTPKHTVHMAEALDGGPIEGWGVSQRSGIAASDRGHVAPVAAPRSPLRNGTAKDLHDAVLRSTDHRVIR